MGPLTVNAIDDQALAETKIQIYVRGAAHRTYALQLKRSDTLADLSTAVQRMGHDLSVDRLCRLGGATLCLDDRLTLDESGLHTNNSVQVLGRLRGGVEVTLFEQQHSLGNTGLLDLKGKGVGPVELKEVAAFFASPESAAVRWLVLSGNLITARGNDLSGLKALCEVLSTLKNPISLDLANCGLGVAEVNELAQAIEVGAPVADLNISEAIIGDAGPTFVEAISSSSTLNCITIDKGLRLPLKDNYDSNILDASEKGIEPGGVAVIAWWLTTSPTAAAIASVKVGGANLGAIGMDCDQISVHNLVVWSKQTKEIPAGTIGKVVRQSAIEGNWEVQFPSATLYRFPTDDLDVVDTSRSCVLQVFCNALKTSQVTEVDFSACGLRSLAMEIVLDYVCDATAALTSINCLMNPIGEDGLAMLVLAVKDTSVRSICGLTEGQLIADFSGMGLGPFDCKIMKAEFDFRGAIAVVDALDLSSCMVTGTIVKRNSSLRGVDASMGGFKALVTLLEQSNVTRINLSDCGLGARATTVLAYYVRASRKVLDLTLSNNPLSGAEIYYNSNGRFDRQIDATIDGVVELFDSLKGTGILHLALSNCGLGLTVVAELAKAVNLMANLTSVNCLANSFGDEGLATLLTAIEGTSVRSLCGLAEGQTIADFSGQNLGPTDGKLMAAEYGFQGFIADVASLTLDSNNIFGWLDISSTMEPDKFVEQCEKAFLCSLKTSNIITLSLKLTGMGPIALHKLAISLPTVVADLNISEAIIGDAGTTLVEAISSSSTLNFITFGKGLRLPLKDNYDSNILDASEKGIEPGGVAVIAWWLTSSAAAVLTSINCLKNPIGQDGLETLVAAVKDSSVRSICGLTEGQNVADFSDMGLTPLDCQILSAEFEFSGLIAAVKKIVLSQNFLFGSTTNLIAKTIHTSDADQTGWSSLCESFKGSSIEELNLCNVGMGVVGVASLADATKFMADLTSVNCLANSFGDEGLATLLTAIEGTSVRSLCGLAEGQTIADFSGQNLGPTDGKLMAAEYGFQGFITAMSEVNVAFNQIGGEGGIALRDALKMSSVKFVGIGKMYTTREGGSVTCSHLTPGVTVSTSGRSGKFVRMHITKIRQSLFLSPYMELKWTHDGTESRMELNSLDGVPLKLPLQAQFEGEHLDLSHQQLDPGHIVILSWRLTTKFSAMLNSIVLDGNLLTGTQLQNYEHRRTMYDVQIDGFKDLCDALAPSQIRDISLQSCCLGSQALVLLADAIKAMPVVADLNISEAIIGDAGATLVEAISSSSTLNCITIGKGLRLPLKDNYDSNILDASEKGIEPGGVAVIAWWLTSSAAAAVNSIALDGCLISGTAFGADYGEFQGGDNEIIEKLDADLSGFNSFCLALKSSQIVSLSLQKCYLGPKALAMLGDAIKFMAAVNEVVLDKNLPSGSKVENPWDEYSDDEIEEIDANLSGFKLLCEALGSSQIQCISMKSCYLGPHALGLLADAIKFMAALTSMNCLNNPLGEGVHAIIKVFEETPRIRTLCGHEEGVEQIDWSNSRQKSADVALLAADVKASRATNSVNSVTLHSNGNLRNQQTYTLTTCETKIVLSETNLGSADVGMLTVWLQRREVGSTIESVDFTRCEIAPTHAMLVWSVADAVSRSRLRTAQVLAFASALHDRLGAECTVFDMADELTNAWRMVAEFVHARHGHEALCLQLARHRPWYKVRVQGPHVPCEETLDEATSNSSAYFNVAMSSPISVVGALVAMVVAAFVAGLRFE